MRAFPAYDGGYPPIRPRAGGNHGAVSRLQPPGSGTSLGGLRVLQHVCVYSDRHATIGILENGLVRETQVVGREAILDVAERLFGERGFRGVTLADVAGQVGIRKPSIYHYFPKGKESLFVAVQTRLFGRIGTQLGEEIRSASPHLQDQFSAAAAWFFSRPPLYLLTMIHHDMPYLSEENRRLVTDASYQTVMEPLVLAVRAAVAREEIRAVNPHIVAGGFLSLLEGNTVAFQAGFGFELSAMMDASLDMMFRGLLRS